MIHRVLVGGSATGKKRLAAQLHRRAGLALLSMDSMKVYRGMDIGTDKPNAQQRAEVPFGLLDLVGHHEHFSAGDWVRAAAREVGAAGNPVLFVGGTPLYLRMLLRGVFPSPETDADLRDELARLWEEQGEAAVRAELKAADPVLEARLFPGDRKRLLRALEVWRLTGRPLSAWQRETTAPPIPGRFLVAALRVPAEAHREAIRARIDRMLAQGLIEEVRRLSALAPFASEPARAIGYAEALDLLAARCTLEQAAERMAVRTRQLVRKQGMFLRSFPEVRWVNVDESVEERVAQALEM